MKRRSEPAEAPEALREKLIGFGEHSGRKSYYPELRERLSTLERFISERERSERALKESEERFRAVFEGAAIGMAVIDLDGHLQSTNRALQELLGQRASELHGRLLLSLVHPEDRPQLAERHAELLRGAFGRVSFEVGLTRADGQVISAQVSTSIATADDGSPAYLVAAVQDITLRKRAQGALEFLSRASVRLASSLDLAGTLQNLTELAVPFLGDFCALCSSTGDASRGQLVACSDPDEKALAEELLAGRFAAGSPGPELLPDALAWLSTGGGADAAQLEILRRLDLRSLIVIPLTTGERRLGTLLLATGKSFRRYGPFDLELASEFGHRAALALENATLLLKAQEASRLKDEFLAILSHELRTPLTAILGWMGLLQTKKLDEAKKSKALTVVERNARALAQIIDDLLGVSRIMAGKLEIQPVPTDLVAVVKSAIDALRPGAAANRVTIHLECAPGTPPVMGDPKRLQQVIWNLVSNAVKYTPEGGQVRVRLARAGSVALLEVSDSGCGITREFLPHLFERFRQADSSSTRRQGGLGLGLAIVQHLVKLHGGTVRAASDGEGRGSCFTVTLPLADAGAAANAPTTDPELPRLPDMRILIVEDDPDTLELIREILERQGARVVPAPSARRALAELEEEVPDLLISDIAMPEQDGVALLQAIRARGYQIPALALSALSRREDRDRALAAGFDRYLVKPVNLHELVGAIASQSVAG
jgi:PAS domain S-box-containing protein